MADTTRASRPPKSSSSKSSGGKIMGIDSKTFYIVGGAAVLIGFLYFYMKSKQQPQGQGSSQGKKQGARQRNYSPTGLTREHIVIWNRGHSGHRHG